MPEPTQAVDPTIATGLTPNTATADTTTTPGAQDGDKAKEQPQTGAAGKVEDLPEWAQRELRETRKEAADRRKALANAEAAAKANEEATLATQQKWEELATKRGAELDALKSKSELADRLSEIVAKQLETEIAAWPESVRAIMPDAESPLLTRIEWAERTRPLAKELAAAQGAQGTQPQNGTQPAAGLRFPAQHPGTGGQPVTTKTVAENTLHKAYAPRKPAP